MLMPKADNNWKMISQTIICFERETWYETRIVINIPQNRTLNNLRCLPGVEGRQLQWEAEHFSPGPVAIDHHQ